MRLDCRVVKLQPDLFWGALSTPQPEMFRGRVQLQARHKVRLEFGAALDMHTGRPKRRSIGPRTISSGVQLSELGGHRIVARLFPRSEEPCRFDVVDDVKVGDLVVIRHGTVAIGTITEAQPKRAWPGAGNSTSILIPRRPLRMKRLRCAELRISGAVVTPAR